MKILANLYCRHFLRTASMFFMAIGLSAGGVASAFSTGSTAENAGSQPVINQIEVSYRTSLYQIPKTVMLPIGGWSDLITTSKRRVFKFKVVPVTFAVKPGLGPVFAVILADATGKEVQRINLGDRATGTFTDFGIELNLLIPPSQTS